MNILVAITFFYVNSRLEVLGQVVNEISQLADNVKLLLVTNNQSDEGHAALKELIPRTLSYEIHVPHLLGHPYLLTWAHLGLFQKYFYEASSYSHYLYLEDDLLFTKENLSYWIESREILRPHSLIPGFVRFELKYGSNIKYATDITSQLKFSRLRKVSQGGDIFWLNLPQPYQGMYLLDRELIEEFFSAGPPNPDGNGFGGIREKAAQGLIFSNVPAGFSNRHAVKYYASSKSIEHAALVHHLSNSYVNDESVRFGKLNIDDLVKQGFFG